MSEERETVATRLAPLLGEWRATAIFPGSGPGEVAGRMTLEPVLGGNFLLQRSTVDIPEAPDTLAVIAANPGSGDFVQNYFDSRNVIRRYAMTFADGVWELLRTTPDVSPLDFRQRYVGTLSDDGDTITGAWEKSDDAVTWEHDFELTYRRAQART